MMTSTITPSMTSSYILKQSFMNPCSLSYNRRPPPTITTTTTITYRYRCCQIAGATSSTTVSTADLTEEEIEAISKVGKRVKVKVALKVYHVPRVPEVELTGMEGVIKQYVGIWKGGKRISANLPFKVEFFKEIEGRGLVLLEAFGGSRVSTMTTKRAYKLQEFVAHTSAVNCLKIAKKSSRVLVTGGEDHKVNLWAIGKPNAILSLSGHTSGIDSVTFDSSEVLVAAGAANGTIKLWDLEEAKSMFTMLFFLRLWDLTAGKLLHEFKSHDGQIQCIDFHPHEFLLATGSADRTVKFWDLETFELIGSTGPETSGVRCLTFNPDGRTLLCGLHESLKVCSWEPIRCHDSVDVGWSKLSDLNVHEGKLLGCSYNQSCVGVWVVDISRTEPTAIPNATRFGVQSESKSSPPRNLSVLNENSTKSSLGRLSVSQNADPLVKETKSLGRLSVSSQNSDPVKESKITSTGSVPGTPQRYNLSASQKTSLTNSMAVPNPTISKRNSAKVNSAVNAPILNKSDIIPVIVPRSDATESKKEVGLAERTMPFSLQSRTADFRKFASNNIDEVDRPNVLSTENIGSKGTELSNVADRNMFSSVKVSNHSFGSERGMKDDRCVVLGKNEVGEPPASFRDDNYEPQGQKATRDVCSFDPPAQRGGRMRSAAINWEKRGRSNYDLPTSNPDAAPIVEVLPLNTRYRQRGHPSYVEKETVCASEEDPIADILEQHGQFVSSMHSRFAKLQAVHRYWQRNDLKGAIGAMEKMADHAILADVMSIVNEKIEIVTLDICTCILPLLAALLGSDTDRHLSIGLDILLKLVRTFGSMVYSALSASTPVGVDIEAEQRLEKYNLCYIELEKVKRCLPLVTRRGGLIAKSAQELNLALQELS
ncbi:hypothetical protein ACFE04_016437 [Oxalis oulophora]